MSLFAVDLIPVQSILIDYFCIDWFTMHAREIFDHNVVT